MGEDTPKEFTTLITLPPARIYPLLQRWAYMDLIEIKFEDYKLEPVNLMQ